MNLIFPIIAIVKDRLISNSQGRALGTTSKVGPSSGREETPNMFFIIATPQQLFNESGAPNGNFRKISVRKTI